MAERWLAARAAVNAVLSRAAVLPVFVGGRTATNAAAADAPMADAGPAFCLSLPPWRFPSPTPVFLPAVAGGRGLLSVGRAAAAVPTLPAAVGMGAATTAATATTAAVTRPPLSAEALLTPVPPASTAVHVVVSS